MNYRRHAVKFFSVFLTVIMMASFFSVPAFAADTTPPAFTPGYPMPGSPQAAGSRQIRVVISAQEPAFYYFVVLTDGAAAPTKEQVAAGQDAGGAPAIKAVNSGASQYTSIDTGTYVPLHATVYDIYVVLKDDAGNLSEPAKVDVTSPPPADFFVAGYPRVGAPQAIGSKQVQAVVKIQNTQGDGMVYYVLVPDGDPAPTIEQIHDGTNAAGAPPVNAGSLTVPKNMETGFITTGNSDAANYDLYLVAGDTYYFTPTASCTGIVKLDVATPPPSLPPVCAIGATEYSSLGDALAAVQDGQTIRLLANIDYNTGISVNGKAITFLLDGFTLNVNNQDTSVLNGAGLEVINGGDVFISGGGALNVAGIQSGVYVNTDSQPSQVTVTSATLTGISGFGVFAYGNAAVTVLGGVTATAGFATGVRAEASAAVTVHGDVTSTEIGTYADYASITVDGNVTVTGFQGHEILTGNGVGNYGGVTLIRGNVTAINIGAGVWDGGNTTIDGTITAPQYIDVGNETMLGIEDYQPQTTKAGYRTYSYNDSETGETSTVWVKDNIPVYLLTVENGTGGGSYAAGTTVGITANAAPTGKVFDHWAAGGTLASSTTAQTTFTMPAAAATVTAVYRDQDTPAPTSYTITASAGDGGSISRAGTVSVAEGGSQGFTITPDSGYGIASVEIDGVDRGGMASYTFENVTANHTIHVFFRSVGSSSGETENPKTGENSGIPGAVCVASSLAVFLLLWAINHKRKYRGI